MNYPQNLNSPDSFTIENKKSEDFQPVGFRKRRNRQRRLIISFIFLLLLVVGVISTFILTQINQDVRQQASILLYPDGQCKPTGGACDSGMEYADTSCDSGKKCGTCSGLGGLASASSGGCCPEFKTSTTGTCVSLLNQEADSYGWKRGSTENCTACTAEDPHEDCTFPTKSYCEQSIGQCEYSGEKFVSGTKICIDNFVFKCSTNDQGTTEFQVDDICGLRPCVNGVCQQCTPGDTKCDSDGTSTLLCNAQARWQINKKCDSTKEEVCKSTAGSSFCGCPEDKPVRDSRGRCVADLVQADTYDCHSASTGLFYKAGESYCASDAQFLTCNADGTWLNQSCPKNQKCLNGACKELVSQQCPEGSILVDITDDEKIICRGLTPASTKYILE